MNTAAAPAWLPKPLVPFFTLSYPADRPLNPDSFPNANYYGIGLQDGWLLVSSMIFFALARDFSRLYILEPLARWKLKRDIRRGERLLPYEQGSSASSPAKGNGTVANGNGHANGQPKGQVKISRREMRELNRRVMRFAEQGWLFIYYMYQWSMGLVSSSNFFSLSVRSDQYDHSTST
jgi:acyl-CoA-dependent ceramide synthase